MFSVSSAMSLLSSVTLVLDGQDARDLALCVAKARAVLEHAGRRLEVQVEELLACLGHLAAKLIVGQGSQLSSSQRDPPPCARTSSSAEASAPRAGAPPWRAARRRRRARTSRDRASRLQPSPPASPCRSPYASRPVSS